MSYELESCQPREDSAGRLRRTGGDRVGSRRMRNQPEPLAVHLDHHHDDDYYHCYGNNPAAHGSADRKRDQSNRRQFILAPNLGATRAD